MIQSSGNNVLKTTTVTAADDVGTTFDEDLDEIVDVDESEDDDEIVQIVLLSSFVGGFEL